MSTHSVRIAAEGDVPALVALMSEFYAESGFPLPAEAAARTFLALIADSRLGHVFLMEDGGRPAGFAVVGSFSGGVNGAPLIVIRRPAMSASAPNRFIHKSWLSTVTGLPAETTSSCGRRSRPRCGRTRSVSK